MVPITSLLPEPQNTSMQFLSTKNPPKKYNPSRTNSILGIQSFHKSNNYSQKYQDLKKDNYNHNNEKEQLPLKSNNSSTVSLHNRVSRTLSYLAKFKDISIRKSRDSKIFSSLSLSSKKQTTCHTCQRTLAIWLDGPREKFDKKSKTFVRCGEWRIVLKSIDNSKNINSKFFDELSIHLQSENNSGNYITRYYGLTQDPKTNNYMVVVQYARNGDLGKYLSKNISKKITWQKKLDILFAIATGLTRIHSKNQVHKNLHSGNILIHSYTILLSDLVFQADNTEIAAEVYEILQYW
ncbi:6067_t:CDS:2 [Entrophospora sp. SA101]|nr:6067_t:CDS:2 [Entrophospora sp. SA101]